MIEKNYIYCGDTIEFMRSLPPECANLIIADPPYNIGKDFGIGTLTGDQDSWLDWSKTWLSEAKRLLHPDGNIFIYAIHHNVCYLQCLLYELEFVYRRQIIWFYENGWSKYKNGPACHYEPLLWFAKSSSSTFHTIREPYKSQSRLKHKIIKNGKVWKPHPDGRQAGDVWSVPTLAGRRFANERVSHPTQKPLSLCRRLIKHFSNPEDLVLVPFVGSGSECVAAIQENRAYLGAEINKEYVDLAYQRINSADSLKTQKAS